MTSGEKEGEMNDEANAARQSAGVNISGGNVTALRCNRKRRRRWKN